MCLSPHVLVHLDCYNRIVQTGWPINNRNLFFMFLEVSKSKIKVPADLMSSEDQTVDFLVDRQLSSAFSCGRHGEGGLWVSFIRV